MVPRLQPGDLTIEQQNKINLLDHRAQIYKKMATYILISTTNGQLNGWTVYGKGTKKEMEELELSHPAFQDDSETHCDIYAQTLCKNSRVVCKTTAKRKYHINENRM